MGDHAVHYSSARTGTGRDDWRTPAALFRVLDEEFRFDLDAAADESNHLCPRWYGPGGERPDALGVAPWQARAAWLNPPYSKLRPFLAKARQSVELRCCALVACLVPARTDTRAWHDEVMAHASEVRLIRGRVRFSGATPGAPFPSAVVVFRARGPMEAWEPPKFTSMEVPHV